MGYNGINHLESTNWCWISQPSTVSKENTMALCEAGYLPPTYVDGEDDDRPADGTEWNGDSGAGVMYPPVGPPWLGPIRA